MIFSNSVAILTDAFPPEQRGFSLGINQIAFCGGNTVDLLVGLGSPRVRCPPKRVNCEPLPPERRRTRPVRPMT